MEGARELLLCFEMTAVTELRLLFLHQKLAFFGVMWRVAIGAPNVVLQVRRAAKICVLFARPMTSLATLPLCSFLAVHGGYEVRRSLVVLVEILSGRVLVAAFAHFGTNIER